VKRQTGRLGATAVGAFVLGAVAGRRWWGRVFVRYQEWSIGLYRGATPFALGPVGADVPVLTARDVDDVPAVFVADPFLFRDEGTWHLFFEVLSAADSKGVIAHASSPDGVRWRYGKVVLEEPFHLSYPLVFRDGDAIYLLPETMDSGGIHLYRATEFPHRWERSATLLDEPRTDPTIFEHDGRWWLFVGHGTENLELYWTDRLPGPWQPHRCNPVVAGDPHHARPAGRVLRVDGGLVRLAQDDAPRYGLAVHGFRITTLTPDEYVEVPAGDGTVLEAGSAGWNAWGMHHCDAHEVAPGEWLASVDGQRRSLAVRVPFSGRAWRHPGETAPRELERYLTGR
jgi:hypothetical protein